MSILPIVIAIWLVLLSNFVGAAELNTPVTSAQCTRLGQLRDNEMFGESVTSERVIAAAREAQADLRAVIQENKRASKNYAIAGTGKQMLLVLQAASASTLALSTILSIPSTSQLVNQFAASSKLGTSYAATELAKRVVGATQLADSVTASKIEQAVAFGSMMPFLGDVISALGAFAQMIETDQEIKLDQKGFGQRIQGLEKQLGVAVSQLARGEFRNRFAKAFKDQVDRLCGQANRSMRAEVPAPVVVSPPVRELFKPPETRAPMSRPAGVMDCGVLDDGEASIDLSMNQPERFAELVRVCRTARGIPR